VPVDFSRSLQDQFAPESMCFGCGPANSKGLQIKSFVALSNPHSAEPRIGTDDEGRDPAYLPLVATFHPLAHHIAFEGIVNGGILSVILDCHLNWTAAWHLMQRCKLEVPPCCVTAKYEVTFIAPTPIGVPLRIESRVIESSTRRVLVSANLGPVDPQVPGQQVIQQVTATGLGTFVAVKPDHPAFHRW
jgi:acyl-coenzyme A thioesterase PaaI-like protein